MSTSTVDQPTADALPEVFIVTNHDPTLIVADTVQIHVSSTVLIETGTAYWKRSLSEGFKDGTAFVRHHEKTPNVPYPKDLKTNDPVGVKLYCAALHERDDFFTAAYINPSSLLSFAQTAQKFNGLDHVKHAAELAMKVLPFQEHALTILHAAFLFKHEEYFGRVTDWMVKYRERGVPAALQKLDLTTTPSQKSVYDAVQWSRRRYLQAIEAARVDLVNSLSSCFDINKDHQSGRFQHRNLPEDHQPAECNLHHDAVFKLEKLLVRSGIKPFATASDADTRDYIQAIHKMPLKPPENDEGRSGDCDVTRQVVVVSFEQYLQALKNDAEDT